MENLLTTENLRQTLVHPCHFVYLTTASQGRAIAKEQLIAFPEERTQLYFPKASSDTARGIWHDTRRAGSLPRAGLGLRSLAYY
jgi:hypothetical protein